MKRTLIGAVLALAFPAVSSAIPAIIPVYGVRATREGVIVRVPPQGSGKCAPTRRMMTMAVDRGAGGVTLLVAMNGNAECRASGGAVDLQWTYAELGLKSGDPFRFANPLTVDPSGAAAGGTSGAVFDTPRAGVCQRLEVDGVLPAGKGAVRVLGPQGPLDVDSPALVAWNEVTGAQAGAEGGQTVVRFTFTPQATQRLAAWTGSHVGSRMAILLDGQVIRLGDISGAITGGIQISGMERAQAVATAAGVSACAG
jgi:hypothetical protein